ncbi:ABC transporter permease [Candidatus Endoriftia persephone str. Guaymas]|jgi:ABC-2 type transport system permease protein|uniref:ABC-type transport system involved in multi-copper enzyme maturation, permease component n=4 Tax=Gammaproteobacteria TaxID=1236 RepID=G2DA56_9GAMM|nr:ABC transporter permease subunit [Candidatus Endoriftia persephone]MBA1333592.1 ABC transporter permease [Candidatus Endoriftia persephone str. Guaymas]EGV52551.1 ABC-type transport system involved in multi-copper enzyme maturation, permease component [endosymbiont of Riftia pachyptila (vent Ph05)]EGW55441.1 putative ABC-2 type transport system permease protein [endosymbiont of Tevnia jerichonana (vent Tica)]KRT55281.1 ABC-2 family transporter protein [endosymbiont of Ridgeia piscesae]KRT59
MKHLWLTAYTDIIESLRARWFMVYSMVFGGLIVILFAFGLAESRIMGFTGLSRLLITYIQLSMAMLPVFVLITTVRSVAGDREAGIFEYLLSLPITLSAWFWGRVFGRFFVVFLPVFLAMLGATAWGMVKGAEIPWDLLIYYTALLMSLAWCFLGIGMLISTLARSSDVAQGAAFVVWLTLLLFLDLILLGVMIRENLPPETAVALALANPMQVFRTATMMLFDPQLVLLGPTAYVILDNFGQSGYIAYALIYPILLGTGCAGLGYFFFKRSDLP